MPGADGALSMVESGGDLVPALGTRLLKVSDDRMKLLKRLFSILLIQEDGDVERALELLRMIGERYGLFDQDLTFEDFKNRLMSEKLIGETPSGESGTHRRIRVARSSDGVEGGDPDKRIRRYHLSSPPSLKLLRRSKRCYRQ